MKQDVRAVAAQVLADVSNGQSLNEALPGKLDKVPAIDRGFLQELCFGSLRQFPLLQGILAQLLDKPLRKKDRDVESLILIGLYQLRDSRVPDHAAVAATVDATAKLKKPWARKLTNALLRRYLRESDQLVASLDPAALSSHPGWLYQALSEQWPEQAAAIFSANNARPPMTLRTNESKITREEYISLLSAREMAAHPGMLSPLAIYLEHAVDVSELPAWEEGAISVQDEAAQLAALVLTPAPGDHILDACAAPGGKACHLLEAQPSLGRLVAMDSDPMRLQRVEENLERLDLQAEVLCGDAANPPGELQQESFDCILVDAPCSATGVIRRHPDIKVLRRTSDIAKFVAQQDAILAGLWPLLKPGGKLLYVTCSVLHEENGNVIANFVSEQDNAAITTIDSDWGHNVATGRQLLPDRKSHDGLFFSLLRKTP